MTPLGLLIDFLGVLLLVKCTYGLSRFLFPYLRSSSVKEFMHGADTYAIVTGASDGIGKAIAQELYGKGFNLILHGRNEAKLWKSAQDIRMSQGPLKDIKVWVADATSPDINFERVVEQWSRLNITLVIHNVSPYAPRSETIDGMPESELAGDLRCGIHFPFLLTRALLPKLRSMPGPAEIVFIGSFGGSHPLPRLLPVSSTKAFIRQLSGSIVADERFPGPVGSVAKKSNISSMYVLVGSVVSGGHRVPESILSPSSETFAKAVVGRIGCGRAVIAPYLPQAVVFGLVDLLPEWLQEPLFRSSIQGELMLLAKRK